MKYLPLFLLTLVFVTIAARPSFGQLSTYNVNQIPYNPDPFTQGSTVALNIDDIYSGPIALPFPVCFFDSSFDSIVIGTNGIVSFDLTQANMFCPWTITSPIPSANVQNYTILAPFQDIDPSAGGTIKTAVGGTAPFRRFIISYYQVPMFNCTSMLFSEQIIIYETTNIIEVHIEDKSLCTNWNNGAAILGIQYNSQVAYAVPGHNFPTQWSAQQESWRFTPVGPCGGPGSAYNIISGKSYGDFNNNCVFDPGTDLPIANRPIHINNGAYYAWTDNQGDYAVAVSSGSYAIGQQILGPYLTTGCPASGSYSVTFPGSGQTFTADFGDSVLLACPDLWLDIGVINMTRCGNEIAHVDYCNLGTVSDTNIVVTIVLPDSITLDSASIPFQALPNNTFAFHLGGLVPWQCDDFDLYLSIGCDTMGTVYCIMGDIAGLISPECDTGNVVHECHPLIGAYDPNDKRVAAQDHSGYVTLDEIDADDELNYMIRFQNTGNDTAFKVVILDTLSPFLNPEKVVVGASSHHYNWTRTGNVVRIEFPDIMLPDSGVNFAGSIGFVKIHAEQFPGHQPGTVIENSAAIYFDLNPPIVTNTTVNTIPFPVATEEAQLQELQLYPNPGQDRITLVWEAIPGDEWVLMDLQGKVLMRRELSSRETTVSTAGLPRGLYLFRIDRNGRYLQSGKWLKM